MAGELFCPDCGGIVGATEATEAGPPCSCFSSNSKSDTAVDMPSPTEPAKPKICVLCGKDVTGHRRLKDSRGYVCYDCAKGEQRKERGDRVRCKICARLVKMSALNDYEGVKMCDRCHAERIAQVKEQVKRIGIADTHDRHEKARLYKLLAVAGVLALIVILHQLKVF